MSIFNMHTSDNLTLFGRDWPVDSPKGLVCLVHGYGEHIGRYDHVATAFNKAGLTVTAYDQRGHGRSEGARGYTPSYQQSLADIATFLKLSREKFPNLPTVLYGHSMGGNMSLNFVLRSKPALNGAIISSPWLALTNPPPPVLTSISRIIGAVYDKFSITQAPYGGGVLSRDPKFDKAFEPDPLTHGVMSNNLFEGVNKAGAWAIANANQLTIPTLLMHGTGDQLTLFDASKQFAAAAPNSLLTFRSWPDYYHEMHNDLGKEAVIEAMINWTMQLTIDD
ncbi:MAG: alpha/beta hydrolase [Ardenticatenaceae bacterium]|nr:alpha/beta hydrolase [Ardenticatenaceae bacterium]